MRKVNSNTYENGDISWIGKNSIVFAYGKFVTKTAGFMLLTTAAAVIDGVCKYAATMDSDNQTVAKERVIYTPVKDRVNVESKA